MRFPSVLVVACALAATEPARATCSVSTAGIAFGAYSFLSPAPLDSSVDLLVACDPGVPYVVRLDGGRQPSAAGRYMAGSDLSEGRLRYDLYRDPAFREFWGDGAGNTFVHAGVGSGGPQRIRVYGRIPPRQAVPPGIYGDAIVVTVEW